MERNPAPTGKPIAENGARWPELAGLLAPAAGCDCQMLAVTIAESFAGRRGALDPTVSRPTRP